MIEYKTLNFEIKEVDDQGVFKGYGSTFGATPDLGGDIVLSGAFKNTLAKKGKFGSSIKMLWQHNTNLPPVGVWKELSEDKKGLAVVGQYALATQMGKELYELSKMNPPAIDSLSIGYEAINAEYPTDKDKGKWRRKLAEIDLYEISPVNFPMNPKATITAVKMLVEEAKNERELEEGLRELGLSHEASKYVVKYMKVGLAEKWRDDPAGKLLKCLRDVSTDMGMLALRSALKDTSTVIKNLK
jgi:HK97 family phage prohead protease